MLKYLYTVIEELLITVSLITLIFAVMKRTYDRKPFPYLWTGIVTGLLVSAAIAFIRHDLSWNKWLNTWMNINQQQVYITFLIFVCSVAMLILLMIFGRKDQSDFGAGGVAVSVFAGLLIFSLLTYEMPGIISNPFDFDTMGKGTISQEWFLRFGGWALALIFLALYSHYIYRASVRLKHRWMLVAILAAGLLINDFRTLAIILRYWTSNLKKIPWPVKYTKKQFPWATPLTIFASRNTFLFTMIIAGLTTLIPVCLFIQHLHVTEPYDNKAQLRRHRFNNRKTRRLAIKACACFAVFVVCLTAVKAYANRTIELSPPESYTVSDDRILVDLEQINDGHLHRFEYTTPNKVAVRWIVIKKPNSGAYGVGLDACDVCGNAGYYERGSQVVCKRCDVVMNINTIGFKGGCNPIPLNYSIDNGRMVFQLEDILAGESEFKF